MCFQVQVTLGGTSAPVHGMHQARIVTLAADALPSLGAAPLAYLINKLGAMRLGRSSGLDVRDTQMYALLADSATLLPLKYAAPGWPALAARTADGALRVLALRGARLTSRST